MFGCAGHDSIAGEAQSGEPGGNVPKSDDGLILSEVAEDIKFRSALALMREDEVGMANSQTHVIPQIPGLVLYHLHKPCGGLHRMNEAWEQALWAC